MPITQQDLLSDLQYALLELPDGAPDGGASWPSEVWTRPTVLDAITEAAAVLQRDTRLVTAYLEQIVLTGARSVSMPGDWLASAHLVFRTEPQQTCTMLIPADAFEADQGAPSWETRPGIPYAYIDGDAQTLEIRLVPTPVQDGVLQNVYIPQPGTFDGVREALPVPEIAVAAVKYGALGTLLGSVTRLQDPERAAYCQDRVAVLTAALQVLLQGGA